MSMDPLGGLGLPGCKALPVIGIGTVFDLHGAIYVFNFFLLTSFSLAFSELSLVGLALDLVD